MIENFFQCPYCWEEISVLLDTSINSQTYVEDCEVCCNPLTITASFSNQELIDFFAQELGQ